MNELVARQDSGKTADEKRYELYKREPLLWGMIYCGEHFRDRSPAFHTKILKEVYSHRFFAIAAPRESAKSTILTFLLPLHAIVFKRKRYIILLMNTYKKAAGALDNIKNEIKWNKEIGRDFGIKMSRDSEGDSIFRHKDGTEVRVLCKGSEIQQMGSIRGEKFGAYRPDLLIMDDLEDDELVKSPIRRRDVEDAFQDAVMPAVDKKEGQIIAIGTILHHDSLIKKLVSKSTYKEFKKLFFVARYNNTSLWEEKWSVEWLNELEKNYPSKFAKEYQNNPVSGVMQRFFKEDFRYWETYNDEYILHGKDDRVVGRGSLKDCKAAIACDLAWEEKKESDFSVIMPAFITPQSDILIDKYVCKKGMRPHEIEEILFSMESRLNLLTKSSVSIGFEKSKLEKVMRHLLGNAMKKRNHYLIFKDLQWDKDKISRIETRLEPRYKQHCIYHLPNMGDLELQLIQFPAASHDDLPDALQSIIQLLPYPKQARKREAEDTHFEWLRKQVLAKKHPEKKRYYFNRKKTFGIPAKESFN